MKLAEQHVIKKSDPRYAAIDAAAFASKNLYNQVTYQLRQAYLHDGVFLPYAELFHHVKHLASASSRRQARSSHQGWGLRLRRT